MHIPPSLYSAMRFNFLYVDRYVFHKGWVYPETYVPYCMLRYILKGSAVFTINGVEYQVHENQVAYIPDSCMLECHALGDDFEFISIRFTVTVRLNDNDFLAEFFHIPPVTENAEQAVLSYFQEVHCNATSRNSSRLFRIRGNLELILAWLVEQTPEAVLEESEGHAAVTVRVMKPTFLLKVSGIGRHGPLPSNRTRASKWWWTTLSPIPRSPLIPNF